MKSLDDFIDIINSSNIDNKNEIIDYFYKTYDLYKNLYENITPKKDVKKYKSNLDELLDKDDIKLFKQFINKYNIYDKYDNLYDSIKLDNKLELSISTRIQDIIVLHCKDNIMNYIINNNLLKHNKGKYKTTPLNMYVYNKNFNRKVFEKLFKQIEQNNKNTLLYSNLIYKDIFKLIKKQTKYFEHNKKSIMKNLIYVTKFLIDKQYLKIDDNVIETLIIILNKSEKILPDDYNNFLYYLNNVDNSIIEQYAIQTYNLRKILNLANKNIVNIENILNNYKNNMVINLKDKDNIYTFNQIKTLLNDIYKLVPQFNHDKKFFIKIEQNFIFKNLNNDSKDLISALDYILNKSLKLNLDKNEIIKSLNSSLFLTIKLHKNNLLLNNKENLLEFFNTFKKYNLDFTELSFNNNNSLYMLYYTYTVINITNKDIKTKLLDKIISYNDRKINNEIIDIFFNKKMLYMEMTDTEYIDKNIFNISYIMDNFYKLNVPESETIIYNFVIDFLYNNIKHIHINNKIIDNFFGPVNIIPEEKFINNNYNNYYNKFIIELFKNGYIIPYININIFDNNSYISQSEKEIIYISSLFKGLNIINNIDIKRKQFFYLKIYKNFYEKLKNKNIDFKFYKNILKLEGNDFINYIKTLNKTKYIKALKFLSLNDNKEKLDLLHKNNFIFNIENNKSQSFFNFLKSYNKLDIISNIINKEKLNELSR